MRSSLYRRSCAMMVPRMSWIFGAEWCGELRKVRSTQGTKEASAGTLGQGHHPAACLLCDSKSESKGRLAKGSALQYHFGMLSSCSVALRLTRLFLVRVAVVLG